MSGNEQNPQSGFFREMGENFRAWGRGDLGNPAQPQPESEPIVWAGPEGLVAHEDIDYVLEAALQTGGSIPDSVRMTPRDRGTVLAAAGILGVRAPEVSRRFASREERRQAGLTGELSGEKRGSRMRLPSDDNTQRGLQMGETTADLIVTAWKLERHRPKPPAPGGAIKNLGTRALGGLAEAHDPVKSQLGMRGALDAIIARVYGPSQQRGRALQGDNDVARSIQAPLAWARALELAGHRGSGSAALLAGIEHGFERSFVEHRQYHDQYPTEVTELYNDLLRARLAAQFSDFELLNSINGRLKEGIPLPQAAALAARKLDRENYPPLERLEPELRYMRQLMGLMRKDGISVEAAAARLKRPVRDIPAVQRVELAGKFAGDMEAKRQAVRDSLHQDRVRRQRAAERQTQSREVARDSAVEYNGYLAANPDFLADRATRALNNGDTDKALMYTMVLNEQARADMEGAEPNFQRMWPQVAPAAINSAHQRINQIRHGIVPLGDVQLIEGIDGETVRDSGLRQMVTDLKKALQEAAFRAYGLITILSPKDPSEPLGENNATEKSHGGLHRTVDAEAVRAAFVWDRQRASGKPKFASREDAGLFQVMQTIREFQFYRTANAARRDALPPKIVVELERIDNLYDRLRSGQRMQKIHGIWALVTDKIAAGAKAYSTEWQRYMEEQERRKGSGGNSQ